MDILRKDTAKHLRSIHKAFLSVPKLPFKRSTMPLTTIILLIIALGLITVLLTSCAQASTIIKEPNIAGYSLNQWCEAIHKAEGNDNYGILSIKCSKGEGCKEICKNTVRNNYKRWIKSGKNGEFIQFLGNKYCPTIGNKLTFNEKKYNINWIYNVKYFLKKDKYEKMQDRNM